MKSATLSNNRNRESPSVFTFDSPKKANCPILRYGSNFAIIETKDSTEGNVDAWFPFNFQPFSLANILCVISVIHSGSLQSEGRKPVTSMRIVERDLSPIAGIKVISI